MVHDQAGGGLSRPRQGRTLVQTPHIPGNVSRPLWRMAPSRGCWNVESLRWSWKSGCNSPARRPDRRYRHGQGMTTVLIEEQVGNGSLQVQFACARDRRAPHPRSSNSGALSSASALTTSSETPADQRMWPVGLPFERGVPDPGCRQDRQFGQASGAGRSRSGNRHSELLGPVREVWTMQPDGTGPRTPPRGPDRILSCTARCSGVRSSRFGIGRRVMRVLNPVAAGFGFMVTRNGLCTATVFLAYSRAFWTRDNCGWICA